MVSMGKTDLAIENYLKAIDLGGALWYHNALGMAYSANNEFPKALPHFEKALESENDGLYARRVFADCNLLPPFRRL